MSGHSKWATIKRKKGANDAQRGKIFTKLGRELAVAVKTGGSPDPATNSRLKDVIAKCKSNNMPNDTIMRSIKKAAGEGSGTNYEENIYEGYGPNGVAVIVETLTDNKNRTAADMRHYFDKFGGNYKHRHILSLHRVCPKDMFCFQTLHLQEVQDWLNKRLSM